MVFGAMCSTRESKRCPIFGSVATPRLFDVCLGKTGNVVAKSFPARARVNATSTVHGTVEGRVWKYIYECHDQTTKYAATMDHHVYSFRLARVPGMENNSKTD